MTTAVKNVREAGRTEFDKIGFPTQKLEAWRFTDISPIAKTSFAAAPAATLSADAIQKLSFRGLEALQLVFVNGRYAAALSTLPKDSGIQAGSMAQIPNDLEKYIGQAASVSGQAFTALNAASFTDGAYVSIPKGVKVAHPIHLLFISEPGKEVAASHSRVLIVADPESKASVVESYASPSDGLYWTNVVTEVFVGDNARVDHYKLQRESEKAYHTSSLHVKQGRSSVFNSHAILLGAAIYRNDIRVLLGEEGAECLLNGLYMVHGTQLTDSHTFIDHAKPHGTSREYYKGILDDKSRGVFDGHVIVQINAQKTDAIQSNKNLLLSNDALINTKPELKIFANDVKCKHGATVGQMNADALFYMRSRGIPLEEARKLMIYAFASEMIEAIELAPLREGLGQLLFAKFQRGSHV